MMLEVKLKQAALKVAVDISLKRMKKSPERCARNLIELGTTAYPDKIPKKDHQNFYQKLLDICKSEDIEEARKLFFETFQ
jgi:hypothetical protein